MSTLAVIDYGMGNLHSVAKALEAVAPDIRIQVTGDPTQIANADRVVFPGVGAIRDCMAALHESGLEPELRKSIDEKPVLAICVGMQALMNHSEENGGVDGLGVFDGRVRFFGTDLHAEDGERLKVPHMGWNRVRHQTAHPLWQGIPDQSRFYFVHSYFVDAANSAEVAATVDYGVRFAAALARGNLFATQFHPEKSQRHGLALLSNFVTWNGGF